MPPIPRDDIYMFVKDIISAKKQIIREKEKGDEPVRALVEDRYEQFDGESKEDTLDSTGSVSETSLEKEAALLGVLFGTTPEIERFSIFSSNIFLFDRYMVVPAEIGAIKYSLEGGISESLHFFLPPGLIPEDCIKQVLDITNDYHKIPHEGVIKYPNLGIAIRALHQTLHTFSGKCLEPGVAWVFIEDDEFEQSTAVLDWCRAQSEYLHLDLEWNLHCVRLSVFYCYFKQLFDEPRDPDWDPFAFKSNAYAYLDLCEHHAKLDCAHCARSKAHSYAYLISDYFCSYFKIKPIIGRHKPYPN